VSDQGRRVGRRQVGGEDETSVAAALHGPPPGDDTKSATLLVTPRSSLGAAIMGKKVGEQATYSLPNGRATTVEILEAVPYAGS
jgi:transcription elongation factor GreA